MTFGSFIAERLAQYVTHPASLLSWLPAGLASPRSHGKVIHNEEVCRDDNIIRYGILKADIRDSTAVINALARKQLNAAMFFNRYFFSPINAVLPRYGAQKVFLEGDAIILSFPEYRQKPEQWHSISRACSLAQALLTIIHANNQRIRHLQLPALEVGIGICYSNDAPLYLYDQKRPIMISSAIGHADRLSSCSRQLQKRIDPSPFNADVLESVQDRQCLHYNVNGILLQDAAFDKLKDEITLKPLNLSINNTLTRFHSGDYPDINGRIKPLLIRESPIGLWQNNEIRRSRFDANRKAFYEVVTSHEIMARARQQL